MSLSHAFKGSDAADAMISDVMMVGAEYGPAYGLTENDYALLYCFVRVMGMIKIPVSDELASFDNSRNKANVSAPVDVVNKLPEFGGRDFFLETGHPDVVILCNIPANPHVEKEDWQSGHNQYLASEREMLRTAFTVSDYHHDEDDWYNWRTKMAEMNPKFILLSGTDSFEPELFKKSGYILIQGPGLARGLYVSKNYLEEVGAYLVLADSPLSLCIFGESQDYRLVVQHNDCSPYGLTQTKPKICLKVA